MKTKLLAMLVVSAAMLPISVSAETKVSTKGGLKVQSGDYTFEFGGRIQYDYNRSEENGEVDEDDFDLRRGRVFVKGTVTEDWEYKVNFNVDGSGAEDLYLRYKGWGSGAVVTVGNQHQPFTLEQLISSKDVSISERSGVTERYLIGRREGVQLHGDYDKLHYALGVFTEEGTNEDTGFAARVAYAPYQSDTGVIHLGASFKNTEEQDALGIEFGAVSGPFHFQAEYFDADEFSSIENEDTGLVSEIENSIDGFYVQAGYFLTGEVRPYKKGTFKRPTPLNKSGAWELALRYSDGDGAFGDVELGNTDASVTSVGINYYLNKNVRINASYMDGSSNISDDDGNELRLRFQVTF